MPTTEHTDVVEEETGWQRFKEYVKLNPLTFYPVPVVLSIGIIRFFVIGDLLTNSILTMVIVVSLGIQWIGMIRGKCKMHKKHLLFDEEQLVKMFKLNNMNIALGPGGFSQITFLSPYKPKRLRAFWYKLTKKRMLALYNMGSGMSSSFTKYIVSEKDWFYLQLRDCIDTTNPEVLAEGRKYLKNNKVATTL